MLKRIHKTDDLDSARKYQCSLNPNPRFVNYTINFISFISLNVSSPFFCLYVAALFLLPITKSNYNKSQGVKPISKQEPGTRTWYKVFSGVFKLYF